MDSSNSKKRFSRNWLQGQEEMTLRTDNSQDEDTKIKNLFGLCKQKAAFIFGNYSPKTGNITK
jgi:hypothetical protein